MQVFVSKPRRLRQTIKIVDVARNNLVLTIPNSRRRRYHERHRQGYRSGDRRPTAECDGARLPIGNRRAISLSLISQ
jgi:hypothetical protein